MTFTNHNNNPSTRGGHSTDYLKQSNNVTMKVDNDEEVEPMEKF